MFMVSGRAEAAGAAFDDFHSAALVYPEVDLSVRLGALDLANGVMPASGCFGPQLAALMPMRELGAAVTKTVFLQTRSGNPEHRISETRGGVINSVGIPSFGAAGYLRDLDPAYRALGVPTIISVGGHAPSEYAQVVQQLAGAGSAYELNVSCPNLEGDGRDIGADPHAISDVVAQVKAISEKPIIVKLPVMTASIAECALAAQIAGADAVCIANSVPVLPLAAGTSRMLGNGVGGLTGPSIRPIVLRLVWLAAQAVSIPIVACGGIETARDALEYYSVGAAAVQVGTATFARPFAMVEIVRELSTLCHEAGVSDIPGLLQVQRGLREGRRS